MKKKNHRDGSCRKIQINKKIFKKLSNKNKFIDKFLVIRLSKSRVTSARIQLI